MSRSTHDIARVCHEINRAYCAAIGDDSQPTWEDAPEWQRDSAVMGVMFCANNPDAPPSAQHDIWMSHKMNDGWVYGEAKDVVAKTHPCLVAYDDLPPEQQVKDHLFRAVVKALTE